MTEMPTHEVIEEYDKKHGEYPEYYHHYHESSDLSDVWYKIDGPNGPAWFKAEDMDVWWPAMMRSAMLEAASGGFDRVFAEDVPGVETL